MTSEESEDDLKLSAYLDGEMAMDEALAFEARLDEDEALRARYERMLTASEGLRGIYRRSAPPEESLTASRDRILQLPPRRQAFTPLLGVAVLLAVTSIVLAILSVTATPADERWRLAIPDLEQSSWVVTHRSILTPGVGDWTLELHPNGGWLLRGRDELTVPDALVPVVGEPALIAPGDELIIAHDGREAWTWRKRPGSLRRRAMEPVAPDVADRLTSVGAFTHVRRVLARWKAGTDFAFIEDSDDQARLVLPDDGGELHMRRLADSEQGLLVAWRVHRFEIRFDAPMESPTPEQRLSKPLPAAMEFPGRR